MKRVLVVDDESDVLESVKELVETVGNGVPPEVRTATSASEALVILGLRRFHLVVSDFEMGSMDGIAFLRAAQRIQPGVPCVLISGHPDLVEDELAAQDISNTAFLAKPIEPVALTQLLLTGLGLDGSG